MPVLLYSPSLIGSGDKQVLMSTNKISAIMDMPLNDVEVVPVVALRDYVLALRDFPVEHGVQYLV